MRASLVVPTRDRAESLARTLRALAGERRRGAAMEVIVVDDGSAVALDEAVAPFESALAPTLVRQEPAGIGAARNRGAALASGDVLIFLDDDVEPMPGFVETHLEVHRRHRRAVALGSLPFPEHRLAQPFVGYLSRVRHYDLCRRYGGAERIPIPPLNGNSSLRRGEFLAAGGYDPDFADYGGEDTELGHRLRVAGLRFVCAPRARGIHHHQKGFRDYLREMRASGRGMARIVAKHPELRKRSRLDVVTASAWRLPPGKLLRRLAIVALRRSPRLVERLEGLLRRREERGPGVALFPLFYLVAHFHYAEGMAEGAR